MADSIRSRKMFFSIYGPLKHLKSKYHKLITSEPSKIRKVTVSAILESVSTELRQHGMCSWLIQARKKIHKA